jgi:putative ABC transport system substrate-binding protein
MRRRDFINLFGSAAVAWPLAARAQQSERVRRVGVLQTPSESDPQAPRIDAFEQALRQLGWVIGDNLRIDYRWGAAGNVERIRRYAAELVALGPDVIVVVGTANVAPLLQATRTVPIVFAFVADPVGAGLVESLARPGGQMTGFLQFEYSLSAKWLELLREIAPAVKRAAGLRDADLSAGLGQFGAIQAVAPSLGLEVTASICATLLISSAP